MISRRLMPTLTARRTATSVKGGFVWLKAMPCWAQYAVRLAERDAGGALELPVDERVDGPEVVDGARAQRGQARRLVRDDPVLEPVEIGEARLVVARVPLEDDRVVRDEPLEHEGPGAGGVLLEVAVLLHDVARHDGRVVGRGQVREEGGERPLDDEAHGGPVRRLDPVDDRPVGAPGRRGLLVEHPLERVLHVVGHEVAPVVPRDALPELEDERGVVDHLPGLGEVADDVHLRVAAQQGRVDVLRDHPAVGGRGLLRVEPGRADVGGDDQGAAALRGLGRGGPDGVGAREPQQRERARSEERAPGGAGLGAGSNPRCGRSCRPPVCRVPVNCRAPYSPAEMEASRAGAWHVKKRLAALRLPSSRELGPQRGHHLAREQRHVLRRQLVGHAADLEDALDDAAAGLLDALAQLLRAPSPGCRRSRSMPSSASSTTRAAR